MKVAEVFEKVFQTEGQIHFSAYDGSATGPTDASVRVHLASPRAFGRLAAPHHLGLARAYVAGELEIEGDLYTALKILDRPEVANLNWRQMLQVARLGGRHLFTRSPIPDEEVRRIRGRRHSKKRDAEAIAHHYDVSNRFYEWVLGPSMAYTCAVYPNENATLEEAQWAKHDLVARKLALRPGMRLLDVGCGWGGMVLHAVRHYGVTAVGVTLSRQQAEWGQKAVVEAGLADRAEIRYLDYRDVTEGNFDAVSSIGLTEHIGLKNLPDYFTFLHDKLRPGGRLLNHCIMRPTTMGKAMVKRGFINRYIFPDGELTGVGHIATVMQNNGFEVRHEENLREHYAKTLAVWCANLQAHWSEAVEEVGLRRARIWALYLAGSQLGFERNHIQLHQLLGVRCDEGRSGMPLRPDWEIAREGAEVSAE
jgi:cyclopropane-fatty-acyl-phospholipid synthase